MIKILKSEVFKFTTLKYIEIIITAFISFFVAKIIGPSEMGKSIPILLFITYSNFLVLGVNSALVKNYSRMKSRFESLNFITINFQFIIIACFLTFLLAYLFIDTKYFLFTALISAGVLVKSFFTAYFRVKNKILILNKNNIIFSILFLFSTLLFVKDWYGYIVSWSICLWIGNALYFFDSRVFFITILKRICLIPSKINLVFNLTEGIKLATFGAIITLLLSIDRFIIENLNIVNEIKGSYQLADFISMGIFVLITTVSFYYTPTWIEKIRNEKIFRELFFKRVKISFVFFPLLILVIYLAGVIFVNLFFAEYEDLLKYVILTSILKILVSYLSIVSIFFISFNEENVLIKSMVPLLVLYFLTILIFYTYTINIIFIPLTLSFWLLIDLMRKVHFVKKYLIK